MRRATLTFLLLISSVSVVRAQVVQTPAGGPTVLDQEAEMAQESLLALVRAQAEALSDFQEQAARTAQSGRTDRQRIATLDSLVKSISQQLALGADITRASEQIRYLTTLDVLTQLVRESEKTRFLVRRDNLSQEFSQITNLANDQRLLDLVQHRDGDQKNTPALVQVGSFLKNPIVGAVFGLTRLFTATERATDKIQGLSDVLCTIDVATTAGQESGVAREILERTTEQLEIVQPTARRLLDNQLRLVGYEGPFGGDRVTAYLEAVASGDNPTEELLGSYLEAQDGPFYALSLRQGNETHRLALSYNESLASYTAYLRAYSAVVKSTSERQCDGAVGFYKGNGDLNQSRLVEPFPGQVRLRTLALESKQLEEEFPAVFPPINSTLLDKLETPRQFAGR